MAPVSTVAVPATPAAPLWVSRPWVDLVVGCGAWSLPLLAVSYSQAGERAGQWAGLFYALALVANYPHYMATVYRAYGAADRAAHRRYTVHATAVLVAGGIVAHGELRLLPWLFTAYVMWSPWHYTGQNYGLLMMFARRAGLAVTPVIRHRLRLAFVASYVMLLAAFNQGQSADPVVLSLGLPVGVATAIGAAAGAAFLGLGVAALAPLLRGAPARAVAAPVTLFITQGLWFVVPVALSWLTSAATPQTRYSSGVLALMHSAQYLWITQYFARREQGEAWAAPRYWWAVVLGGIALFLPVPWLASYGAHVDFTASVLIVTAVVNLHHFMIDGVVWKLRDPRVARTLTAAAPASDAGFGPASSPWWRHAAGAAVAVALVSLAAVDQWRYRLTLDGADPAALEIAARVNPYDSAVQGRLLRALADRGDDSALRTHLEGTLARNPGDVDAQVNAGVLARRQGRLDDAERHWTDALARAPGLTHVHMYLAELLDEQHRPSEAAVHYRAYLEHVVAGTTGVRPDPAAVVPVVLKFGDALERAGQAEAARTQFELAAAIAGRTGLAQLEAAARERLESAPIQARP